MLGSMELLAQLDDLAKARHEGAEDVSLRGDLVRLPVVAERRLAAKHDGTAVRFHLPGDDAQERRLARAVRRDERHAIADGEREGDVLEERISGVPEPEVGHLQDGHAKAAEELARLRPAHIFARHRCKASTLEVRT